MKFKKSLQFCKKYGLNAWTSNTNISLKKYKAYKNAYHRNSLFYKILIYKKLLRQYYGDLSVQKFKFLIKNIKKSTTDTLNTPLIFEQHLYMIVYRLHWALSIPEAKQQVRYGTFLVNGHTVHSPYALIKKNDIIQVNISKFSAIVNKLGYAIMYNLKLKKYVNSLFNNEFNKHSVFFKTVELTKILRPKTKIAFCVGLEKTDKEKYVKFIKNTNKLTTYIKKNTNCIYYKQSILSYKQVNSKHYNFDNKQKSNFYYNKISKLINLPAYFETNLRTLSSILIEVPKTTHFSNTFSQSYDFFKKFKNGLK